MSITDRVAELEASVPRFQALGWGTAPSDRAGSQPSGVAVGQFINPNGIAPGAIAQTLNLLVAQAFDWAGAQKIDQTFLEVTVAGTTGNVARLGFYLDDGSGNKPGALLLDAGTQSATTTGVKTFPTVLTLPQGRIWVVTVSQVGVAGTHRTVNHPTVSVPLPVAPAATASAFPQATNVTGALPAQAPALTGVTTGATRVYFRAA